MTTRPLLAGLACSLLLVSPVGCGDDSAPDDAGRPPDSGARDGGPGVDADVDAGPDTDAGPTGGARCEGLVAEPPTPECTTPAEDYVPGADDTWDPCISDDGEYHRIEPTISTIARVMAFERLRAAIFDPTRDPSPDEMLAARMIYQEEEGLDSRVARRYDPHVEVPDGTDCSLPGVPEAFPDYCVGPGTLQPTILDALAAGIAGEGGPSRLHAARVEGALLWMLYVSSYKEATTCVSVAKDCDSAYAYYTGGEPAFGGIGLSADVARAYPAAHMAAWHGALALRCWRDLDPAVPAEDLELAARARAQYDRALLAGVAAVARERLVQACETTGSESAYHFEVARLLARALSREAAARDAAAAAPLLSLAAAEGPDGVDVAGAVDAIDAMFDCP